MWQPRNEAERQEASASVAFVRHLKHGKGKWAGLPFNLAPWQQDQVIEPLFGTLRSDGLRQYRQAYIEVPRKNGKTELAAAIALKLLLADGEAEGEVYAAASDRDQASLVFNAAGQMVRSSPRLSRMCRVVEHTKRIVVTAGPCIGSFLRAIPADAAGAHGFNASGVVADEVHTWRGRELWDVLGTSTGAREQPLIVAITTAGYDRASLCWELHEHARQLLEGTLEDPTFLPVLYGADDDDDWTDPKIWWKANPNLGVTLEEDYFTTEVRKAQQMPGYQNAFRRLHLDQWTSAESRWMPMEAWDACSGSLPTLDGRACFGGLDLASTTDLAAFVLVFPPDDPDTGDYHVLPKFFAPESSIKDRSRRDHVPYEEWVERGWLIATPGDVIDYATIRREVQVASMRYRLLQVGFDPWNAIQLSQDLETAGVEMMQIRQGFASLSAPTKELLGLVLQRRFRHGGNRVLRWMADNVMVEQDAAGNLKPSKRKSTQRIDGIVASIMALDLALRHKDMTSVYETRDVVWL